MPGRSIRIPSHTHKTSRSVRTNTISTTTAKRQVHRGFNEKTSDHPIAADRIHRRSGDAGGPGDDSDGADSTAAGRQESAARHSDSWIHAQGRLLLASRKVESGSHQVSGGRERLHRRGHEAD